MKNNLAKVEEFKNLLEKQKSQIALVLPKHLDVNRLARIALTSLRKNEKLSECNSLSVIGAIMQASQLGVEIDNGLGHGYLVPYKDECQFILGYRGMIDLARRSGQIISLSSHAFYENDTFDFEYGINEKLRHIPYKDGDRGKFVGAYAIAHLKGGGHQIEVMFKHEIDKIRSQSKAASSSYSPWATHYEEMAKKTVIRRLFKYLPSSIEIQRAVVLDEQGEYGEQENSRIFDSEDDFNSTSKSEQKIEKFTAELKQEKE